MFVNTLMKNIQQSDLINVFVVATIFNQTSVVLVVIRSMRIMKHYGKLKKREDWLENRSKKGTYLWLIILKFK